MDDSEIVYSVKEAALRLDEVYPDWFEHIDLETLDLNYHRTCIAGQLTKAYGHASYYQVDNETGMNCCDGAFVDGWGEYETFDKWVNEVLARRKRKSLTAIELCPQKTNA